MTLAKTGILAATIAVAALAARAPAAQEEIGGFKPGVDFTVLPEAQPTSSPADKVEVAEVFMYSCPHCYRFEPLLQDWIASKADYINVVRIPAPFNDWAVLLGRAYYTAEILGKLDEMHEAFFEEIHDKGNLLQTPDALREFFGRFGVSGEDFDKVFTSDEVKEKMMRAYRLIKDYQVDATPTMVIDGKYVSMGSQAGTYSRWFEIIDALAASEAKKH